MRNHVFEAQSRPCANGKHAACLSGIPPRASGIPGIREVAFEFVFPGGDNSKVIYLRDFAFKCKISKRFCSINFVRCLIGASELSEDFTDFHRFSPIFN